MTDKLSESELPRRMYLKLAAAAGGAAALAGCSGGDSDDPEPSSEPASQPEDTQVEQLSNEIPDVRMDTATFVPSRQFDNDNYERMHLYRKRRAIDTLLADPEVNDLASGWLCGFEAYEVLSNHLEAVSIQGTPELEIEESGFPDGEEAQFDVTGVDRQTVYGLIDRHTDEIVALEITEPTDVTWEATQEPDEMDLGVEILESDVVQEEFGELESGEWYPESKSSSGSITGLGLGDLEQAEGGTARLFVKTDDQLKVISAYIDGTDSENPEILEIDISHSQVEYPLRELADQISPNESSVAGDLPTVPFEKRPPYSANGGFHRLEDPPSPVDQGNWEIEWQQAEAMGVTYSASYNGSPVFEAMNVPCTMTGYYLPPREGRNTLDWYFPDGDSVYAGDLLFWDILGRDGFGGPGMIGKFDFPQNRGTPSGFRFKNHYHTGAAGRESQDFHSGIRFGPYNYDFAYDFFEDGVLDLVFRRAGPGYITKWYEDIQEDAATYGEDGSYEEPVVQHYAVGHAMAVTPGTEEAVTVELFDGDEWTEPTEEFYEEGSKGMVARFSNPDGPESVKIPLNKNEEIVVVQQDDSEVGPGEATLNRLDDDLDEKFYHPAQYVQGRPIQGERVIVWLLQLGETNGMPYPSGSTNFATSSQIELSGYE